MPMTGGAELVRACHGIPRHLVWLQVDRQINFVSAIIGGQISVPSRRGYVTAHVEKDTGQP